MKSAIRNAVSMFLIAVTSDGRVTRDDHTYPLSSNSQNRFEVVQVNALTAQDLFTNQSTVQGAPSYIIQAPAGQTYIIQQPTGNLVRQTHSEDLTGPSEDLTTGQHDQVKLIHWLTLKCPSHLRYPPVWPLHNNCLNFIYRR